MVVVFKDYKVFAKKPKQAFIILESVISILILSFYILTINMFLLDVINFLFYLEFIAENFNVNRNITSCLSVYHNEALCNQIFKEKMLNENKNR